MLILPPEERKVFVFHKDIYGRGASLRGQGQGKDVMKENNWGSLDQKNILGGSVKQ